MLLLWWLLQILLHQHRPVQQLQLLFLPPLIQLLARASPFFHICTSLLLLLLPMHQIFSGVVSQLQQSQCVPPSCGGHPKRLITILCSCQSHALNHLVGVAAQDDVIQVRTTYPTTQRLDLLQVLGPAVGSHRADVSQRGRLASKHITDNLNCWWASTPTELINKRWACRPFMVESVNLPAGLSPGGLHWRTLTLWLAIAGQKWGKERKEKKIKGRKKEKKKKSKKRVVRG